MTNIENQQPTVKRYRPLVEREFTYLPDEGSHSIDTAAKKVLVVSDDRAEDSNLCHTVARYCRSFSSDIELINLRDVKIISSCIGCLQCGYDNECVLSEHDDYAPIFREKVLEADVLIFAGAMIDRHLSSLWKTYFDRSFFRGHCLSLIGKQLGIMLSGPLTENEYLRDYFERYAG